jgi:hypothetical protein
MDGIYGTTPVDLEAAKVAWSWWCQATILLQRKRSARPRAPDVRFGHRYVDILDTSDDGPLRVDYGRFHDTLEE